MLNYYKARQCSGCKLHQFYLDTKKPFRVCSAKPWRELGREENTMMSLSNSEANLYLVSNVMSGHPALKTIRKNRTGKKRQDQTRKLETWNGNMEGESHWIGNLRWRQEMTELHGRGEQKTPQNYPSLRACGHPGRRCKSNLRRTIQFVELTTARCCFKSA